MSADAHKTPVCKCIAVNFEEAYVTTLTLVDPHSVQLRDPYRDRQSPVYLLLMWMQSWNLQSELLRHLPLVSPHASFAAPHPDAVSLLATLRPFPQHCTTPELIPCMYAKCIEQQHQ